MNEYHKISEGILGEETIEKTNTELFLSLVGQYFPEAIKDGEVDFTALKEEMGEFHEVGSEHYDFTWAGKQSAKKEAQSDIFGKTLKYKPQDSLNPDTTENIYIEGDNLEALKLLRRNYHGKIKMIYIDPPYNTGKDFVYRDNFTMTEEELAKLSGDIKDGVRLQKNPKDNAKYHTNWLNMIYPRLKIVRDLLADDGIIFISIDDNEVENLRKICNEIFGVPNFIANLIWKSKSGGANDSRFFAVDHEYILVYAKSADNFELGIDKEATVTTSYNRKDEKGEYALDRLDKQSIRYSEALDYEIIGPDGKSYRPKHKDPTHPNATWRWSKKNVEQHYDELVFENDCVYTKNYKKEGAVARSLLLEDRFGRTRTGKTDCFSLFNRDYFSNPKPYKLIRYLQIIASKKDSIILDFFSGSATTAHAVMQLNAEDGGNRKFIMVQFPEKTDEKSEAYKAGYKNICEIGKERIRRAAKKIHEDNPEAKFDDGFKVFEVADTNIRWNTTDDKEIISLADNDYSTGDKDNIDFTPGHNDIDIVYEIMLRQFDIPLSTPIEKLPQVSDRTYIFADAVVVCLEPEIDEKLIEKLASIEPVPGKFVLRDSAFNDDIELKDVSHRRLSALIANHKTEEERNSKYNNYTVEFI